MSSALPYQPLPQSLFKDQRPWLMKETRKIMFWQNHLLLSVPSYQFNLYFFACNLISFISSTKENANGFVLL